MNAGEISLDYIPRRLDDLQREAAHHRLVADMLIKQFRSLYSEFDAQRAHLHVIDSRLEQIESRLDRMEQRIEYVEQRTEHVENRLNSIEQRMEGLDGKLDLVLETVRMIRARLEGER